MKLYATVDFADEIIASIWTPKRLLKYFKLIRSKGITRLYWIDQQEIMERCGKDEINANMVATIQNFSGRIHETAVQLAHEAGLEIFVLIKPYECGLLAPALSDDAIKRPHLPVAGGICDRFTSFAKKHPEAMLQRIPVPMHGEAAVLTLLFSAPLVKSGLVRLWASETNCNYQLIEEKSVPAGFQEISFTRPTGKNFFVFQSADLASGNTYEKIISISDTEERPVPFSLGIQPKRRYVPIKSHLEHRPKPCDDGGFKKMGMLFDYFPGIPSGLYTSNLPPNWYFDFANATENALGVSLEINDRIVGFPDPTHPAHYESIRQWVERDLAMGFDGLDVRVSSHSSPIFWRDYGFGSEVRRTRGEAHNQLLRMISKLVRAAGKVMSVHIEDFMYDSTPELPSPMEFFWDYHRWINERLMDEVTAKMIFTDGLLAANFALACECRAAGIKVNTCPFLHNVSQPLVFASWSAQAGIEAFNIYETATVWQADAEGDGIAEINPAMLKQLCRITEIEVPEC